MYFVFNGNVIIFVIRIKAVKIKIVYIEKFKLFLLLSIFKSMNSIKD